MDRRRPRRNVSDGNCPHRHDNPMNLAVHHADQRTAVPLGFLVHVRPVAKLIYSIHPSVAKRYKFPRLHDQIVLIYLRTAEFTHTIMSTFSVTNVSVGVLTVGLSLIIRNTPNWLKARWHDFQLAGRCKQHKPSFVVNCLFVRPRCTKCNSPPINGQCTNHVIAA